MIKILGLARRAKKLIIGTELTVKGVRTNRVKLVLLAIDASSNTKKLIYDKCKTYNVDIVDVFSSDDISKSIGKKNIKVLGITDDGFSKHLLNQAKEVNNYGQENDKKSDTKKA